jgi:ribosomal protein L11 methyltransferase
MGSYIEEIVGKLEPRYEVLPDTNWKDSYKAHFKPWSFEGLHWVPVWERETYPVPYGEAVVWLDPGMAFGTGNHETTRLCIEALIVYLKDRQAAGQSLNHLTCCDAGCGSGILAISARKMGFASVVGFDNDPDAVRISHENTELNDLVGEVGFWEGDLEGGFKKIMYDLVFANILGVVLMKHPHELLTSVNPGGRLILSGILTQEVEEVHSIYLEMLHQLEKKGSFSSHVSGEWSDLVIDLDY